MHVTKALFHYSLLVTLITFLVVSSKALADPPGPPPKDPPPDALKHVDFDT